MLIKYTCDSKSQTLRMHYPFQSTGRPISHRNGWSILVYTIPLQDFILEWNSCPGTTTGVNPRRVDSCRHDILWWYHVNKYRVMRGNRRWTRTRAKVALMSCKHSLRLSFLILCSETTRKHLLGRLVESLISSWWIKFFGWRVLLNPFPEGANKRNKQILNEMALIESHYKPLKRLRQLFDLSYAWKDCLIPYPLKASFRNSWSWLTRWTNTLKSFCTSLAWRNSRFGKVVGRRVNGACSTVKYDFLDCMTRPWVKQ